MMKKVKVFLVCLLVLTLGLSMIGCSDKEDNAKNDETTTSKGSTTESKVETKAGSKENDIVTITALIARNGDNNFPEENKIQKLIGEKVNINFKPIMVLNKDMAERRNIMIAAGEVPDIMPLQGIDSNAVFANAKNYQEKGLIIPLDELLTDYGKNILESYGKEPFDPFVFNGKTYAIPAQMKWSRMIAIRKDWVENLGLDIDKYKDCTLDEYFELLKIFTENDPDGNNTKDTFGIVLGSEVWMYELWLAAFGYMPAELYEKDGMLLPGVLMPEVKDMAAYIRKLIEAGVVDSDFVLTDANLVRDKISSGKYGSFYHNWPFLKKTHPAYIQLLQNVPDAELIDIAPPKGPEGKRGVFKNSPVSYMAVYAVTSSCENPDKAVQLMDYICSEEGRLLSEYGEMGIDSEIRDGKVSYLKAADVEYKVSNGIGAYQMMVYDRDTTIGIESPDEIAVRDRNHNYGLNGIQLTSVAPSETKYAKTLDDVIKEYFFKMLAEDGDLDKMYDDFVKAYMENGGEILSKERYELYKAMGE